MELDSFRLRAQTSVHDVHQKKATRAMTPADAVTATEALDSNQVKIQDGIQAVLMRSHLVRCGDSQQVKCVFKRGPK